MNIPKKIKIGGHYLEVKIVAPKEIDNEGSYDRWHRNIRLRDRIINNEDSEAEAFQHEIFEAIKHLFGLEAIPHRDLTVLSEVYFSVLRDNQLNFLDDA